MRTRVVPETDTHNSHNSSDPTYITYMDFDIVTQICP